MPGHARGTRVPKIDVPAGTSGTGHTPLGGVPVSRVPRCPPGSNLFWAHALFNSTYRRGFEPQPFAAVLSFSNGIFTRGLFERTGPRSPRGFLRFFRVA